MRIPVTRSGEIDRLRNRLERDGFPRLQMSFLVAITGASGFVASFLLFHAGLRDMSWRYLAACTIAYAVFLLLLWLWLRTKAEDYADIPDPGNALPTHGTSNGESACYAGKDGEFGGGGASASFDDGPASAVAEIPASDGVVGEVLNGAAAADELAIPLFLLVLLAGLLLSSLYVVYSAPVLFAEMLLDGMLAAGLYRRLRGMESRHWLDTALRNSVWPFILTALMFFLAGWLMALYAPEAETIGAVLYHSRQLR